MATKSERRLVVCGAGGLLGQAVVAAGTARSDLTVTALAHAELDIASQAEVERVVSELQPGLVLNCAGYTNVDGAESDVGGALLGNSVGPAVLAQVCAAHGAVLMHVSTDHVFGGEATIPYREEDPTAPPSIYGRTKLAGEEWVRALQPRHYLVRTAGLFGAGGRNFVAAIASRALRGESLRVVCDQVCARTYAADLAAAMLELGLGGVAFGTYHVTNPGADSWYGFAQEIVRRLGSPSQVRAVTTAEWGAPAPRPAYSELALERWAAAGLTPLRPMGQALGAYLESEFGTAPANEARG